MFRFAILGGFLLASLGFVAAQTDDARPAVPAKDAVAKAEKMVKEIFKADFQKTKPADRSAFAKNLFDRADESKDDEVARFVFLREARDVAGKGGDLSLYLTAAKKLAASFKITEADAIGGGSDYLAAGMASAGKPENAQSLIDLVDDSVRNGDFATALKILKVADAVVKKAPAPTLTAAVQSRSKSLPALKREFDKLPEANKTLEKDPTDKKANLLVGRFLCYVKNDWDAGLVRLLLGAEGPLRVAVEKDVAAASGGETERIAAGDQWKKLAATAEPPLRSSLEGRALHWYLLSLDEATGLSKVKLEKSIQEMGTGENKWRILSHQMNDPKNWQTKGGNWTQEGKTVIGEGQASRAFQGKIPSDCVIQFEMTIFRGDRTRIHLNQGGPDYWLGCEGDGRALTFYGAGATGKAGEFVYPRGQPLKVKIEFRKDRVAAAINDAPTISARRGSPGVDLRISVGDGFSGGKSSYSNFRISADGR
jgi:hypothetical protein